MAYHEDIVTDINGKIRCELCKILLRDGQTFIEDHLNDKEHVNLFMHRLMLQNGITMCDKRINCSLCEEGTDLKNVINHIQSSRHEDTFNSLRKIVTNDGGFLVLPETITNLGSKVDCLICNLTMKFNLDVVKSHIASERHRRARSIAVQPLNAIFSVEDSKDDLWCKICQVYFENYVEVILEHVDEDPKHLKELGKLFWLIKGQNITIEKYLYDPKEDKAMCNKCQIGVPCNLDNLERHIKGKKHTS